MPTSARQPELRRLLRLGRGDEPRRRERLVHAELQRQRLGADHERQNYTAAGILAALTPILPAGATATVAGFGGGAFNNTGFQVTFAGTLATTNVPVTLALQDFTAGASGFVGETDKGGAVDNKGGGDHARPATRSRSSRRRRRTRSRCGRRSPSPAARPTPTATRCSTAGSRTTAARAAGTSLLNNTKTNGPLFAMFPKSGQISPRDTLLYDSPGENHLTTTRRGCSRTCSRSSTTTRTPTPARARRADRAAGAAVPVKECFAEFLPTRDYVGFAGTNASPLSLHFRLTARDGRGGVNSADTTLLLAPTRRPVPRHRPEHAPARGRRARRRRSRGTWPTRTSRRSARPT